MTETLGTFTFLDGEIRQVKERGSVRLISNPIENGGTYANHVDGLNADVFDVQGELKDDGATTALTRKGSIKDLLDGKAAVDFVQTDVVTDASNTVSVYIVDAEWTHTAGDLRIGFKLTLVEASS